MVVPKRHRLYRYSSPHPPPPGVSIRSTSPARTRMVHLSGSRSARLSSPPGNSQFSPGAPGPPPASPQGRDIRRSVIKLTVTSSSINRSRSIPSPHPAAPPPQPVPQHPHRVVAVQRLDGGVLRVRDRGGHAARRSGTYDGDRTSGPWGALVELAGQRLDVPRYLSFQGGGQHPARTLADDLVQPGGAASARASSSVTTVNIGVPSRRRLTAGVRVLWADGHTERLSPEQEAYVHPIVAASSRRAGR